MNNSDGDGRRFTPGLLTDILDAQGTGFRFFVLIVAIADIARILPPFVVEQVDGALLLQFQNGQ